MASYRFRDDLNLMMRSTKYRFLACPFALMAWSFEVSAQEWRSYGGDAGGTRSSSLTQINPGPDDTPLVPGQRVIVPRHLVPLAAVAGQSPSKR